MKLSLALLIILLSGCAWQQQIIVVDEMHHNYTNTPNDDPDPSISTLATPEITSEIKGLEPAIVVNPKPPAGLEQMIPPPARKRIQCETYRPPPTRPIPRLTKEELDKVDKTDTRALNRLLVDHIGKLNAFIITGRYAHDLAYKRYIVSCK